MTVVRVMALGALATIAALAVALGIGGRQFMITAAGWLASRGQPTLRLVDAATLARELATPAPPRLLDVREPAEFAMSHLAAAENVRPGPLAGTVLALPRETRIVTYCAVGVRAAATARRLTEAGFTDVRVLEGSLFAWANAGRPLVGAAGPTALVHPVSRFWRLALNPAHRGPLP